MAYVYSHTRLDNGKVFYIGIGSDKKYSRAFFFKNRNHIWKSIYNKTPIKVDILFDNLSWEEACAKESELIKSIGRIDLKEGTLSNLTDGGEGLFNPAESVREKLRYEKSEKHREFIRSLQLGVKQSPEHIQKRLSHKFHDDPEYREKQRLSHIGKRRPEEVIQKLRRAKGPMSPEHKEKISKAKKGKESKTKGLKRSPMWSKASEVKELRALGWSIEKLRLHFRCCDRIIREILSN